MMTQMLAALVRRATDGDLFALEVIADMRRKVEQARRDAARGAHDGPAGYSWTEIAAELGMTRQAARQLYGDGWKPATGIRLNR